jgi:hypothetical protein
VARAHGQAPEAQPAQQLAHRALVRPRPEAPLDEVAQIGAAPARQAAVLGRVRPRLDPPFHLGLLRRRQARLRAGAARPVGQARDALGVVAVHPVAQRLPVHAALGRRRPSSTSAIASIRRAVFASRVRAACRRKAAADGSVRVIATAILASRITIRDKRIIPTAHAGSQASQRSGPLV